MSKIQKMKAIHNARGGAVVYRIIAMLYVPGWVDSHIEECMVPATELDDVEVRDLRDEDSLHAVKYRRVCSGQLEEVDVRINHKSLNSLSDSALLSSSVLL